MNPTVKLCSLCSRSERYCEHGDKTTMVDVKASHIINFYNRAYEKGEWVDGEGFYEICLARDAIAWAKRAEHFEAVARREKAINLSLAESTRERPHLEEPRHPKRQPAWEGKQQKITRFPPPDEDDVEPSMVYEAGMWGMPPGCRRAKAYIDPYE